MATYLSIHSGAQIDSAVTTVLATSNWDTLQSISSSGGNVSVGDTVLADQAYVNSRITTVNGNSGAVVLSGGTGVSIDSATSGGTTTFTFDAQGGTSGDYLPLSGGTISGGITVVDDVVISSGGSTIASLRALASGGGGGDTTVTSVNGKTGDVTLTASDVDAIKIPVNTTLTTTLSSATSRYNPEQLCVYSHTVTSGESIAFDAPANGEPVEFKLDLTVPDPAVPFSFVSAGSSGGVTWPNGAPDFSSAGGYQLYFEYDNGWYGRQRPDMNEYARKSEYLPLSGGTLSGVLYDPSGYNFHVSVAGGILHQTSGCIIDVHQTTLNNTNGGFYSMRQGVIDGARRCVVVGRGVYATGGEGVIVGGRWADPANSSCLFCMGNGTDSAHRSTAIALTTDGVCTVLSDIITSSGGFITSGGDVTITSGGSTVASLKDVATRVNTLETTISGALASI